jgi:hypothetical protein
MKTINCRIYKYNELPVDVRNVALGSLEFQVNQYFRDLFEDNTEEYVLESKKLIIERFRNAGFVVRHKDIILLDKNEENTADFIAFLNILDVEVDMDNENLRDYLLPFNLPADFDRLSDYLESQRLFVAMSPPSIRKRTHQHNTLVVQNNSSEGGLDYLRGRLETVLAQRVEGIILGLEDEIKNKFAKKVREFIIEEIPNINDLYFHANGEIYNGDIPDDL